MNDDAAFAPDAERASSSLTHQRVLGGASDHVPFLRCEFEAELAAADTSPETVYRELSLAVDLPEVEWRGWRCEPTAIGIDKLIVIARLVGELDIFEDDCLADQVLEALQDTEHVQAARLLSTAANCPDTYAVCRSLFSVTVADLNTLKLPCLGATAATSLMAHGYAIVDGFLPSDVVNSVAALAKASLHTRAPDGVATDGIAWRHPEPRAGRTDVATWVEAGGASRPGCDEVFAKHVLPRIHALAADVRSLMDGVRGTLEVQLACFHEGGRQCRHTDGVACGDPAGGDRKVTCILYANPRWEEAHAGKLRLQLADHDGGGTVDVEPCGGRLLCFLAGAMVHEVLPTHADRYAVTAWLT